MDYINLPETPIIFGPVPSRRLGRSLGINNIPAKICSYSCVYCQLGRTRNFASAPASFYDPALICERLKEKTDRLSAANETFDYVTFVSDGEPTLDSGLLSEINYVKSLGYKTAVITNSSLICDPLVSTALKAADIVCLKVDAVFEDIWIKINRPAKNIQLRFIMDGILKFSREYNGTLITDTMFIDGLNLSTAHLEALGDYLLNLSASKNYISVITRPPAEERVKKPPAEALNEAYQIINGFTGRAEYNTGYEGDNFNFMYDVEKELLGIISVHPMREDALEAFLKKASCGRKPVERLIKSGKMIETVYDGMKFYIKKI